jgi:uncharacterized membrane protein (DUF2068 family)
VEKEYQGQVRADTGIGTAWRCLRCGDFVLDVPTASGPVAEAPMPLRGNALRSRFIMRLLAVERIFRFLLVGLGAYAVWKFSNSEHSVQMLFEKNLTIFKPVAQHYGYDLDNSSVVTTIRKLFTYKHSSLDLAAAALALYAVIELIEAIGLWLAKRWGEYFAAVATSLFLPVEIYELTEHATKFKIATFALNVLAVVYLVWAKRLFGVRGGGRAYEAELTSESLLHEPTEPVGPAKPTGAVPNNGVSNNGVPGGGAPSRTVPDDGLSSDTLTNNAATLPLSVAEPTVRMPLGEPPEEIVQA